MKKSLYIPNRFIAYVGLSVLMCFLTDASLAEELLPSVQSPNVLINRQLLESAYNTGLQLNPVPIQFFMGDQEKPDNDFSSWKTTDQFIYPEPFISVKAEHKPVWFRFPFQVSSDVIGVPLLLQTKPFQDSLRVYLNDKQIESPQDTDPSTCRTPQCFVLLQPSNIITLRWEPNTQSVNQSEPPVNDYSFTLILQTYKDAIKTFDRNELLERNYSWHRIFLIAIFSIFFLFHLGINGYSPIRRENIYYGLTSLFLVLTLAALHISELYHYDRDIWRMCYLRCFLAFMPLSIICGLGLFQLLLTGVIRWTIPLYSIIAVFLYGASFYYGNRPIHIFPILLTPELLWIIWLGKKHNRIRLNAGMIVILIIIMSSVVFTAIASINKWNSESGFLRYAPWYLFALFLQFVLGSFAREYAENKKKLEEFAASLEEQVAKRTRELQLATTEIKTLQGILPICMHCHKIRSDHESWQQLELYIQKHSKAQFSHGICPDCVAKHYPNIQYEE